MSTCSNCGLEFSAEFRFCPSCGTVIPEGPSSLDSLLGRTIKEKYRVVSCLGSGSTGTVFLAEHIGLKKRMALKVLRSDLQINDESLRRFQQEGIAAGKFTHPNAIQIFDFDRDDRGFFYLAMEFVEGMSLKRRIQEERCLAADRATGIARQVLSVLAEAHGRGIVHRDLKPDNIMVVQSATGEDTVKVLDFGLSKLIGLHSGLSLQTQTGRILGTPLYMAPEQCAGGAVDHRADLYAVGVILFEMLAGKPPFGGDNVMEVLFKHTKEPPPSLLEVNPDITLPEDLEGIVTKALAKKPEDRYQSAQEMLSDLAGIRFDRLASGRDRVEASPAGRKGARWLPMAVAGVLLASVAGLVTILSGPGGGPEAPRERRANSGRDATTAAEPVAAVPEAPDPLAEARRLYASRIAEARRHLAQKDASAAMAAIEGALGLALRDAEAYVVRGQVFLTRGDLETALADFEDALAIDPEAGEALCGIGWVHLERGELEPALAVFEKASALDPDLACSLVGRGIVHYRSHRSLLARDLFESAVRLDPSSVPAHLHLGRIRLELGEIPGAVAAIVEAKRRDPRSWEAYVPEKAREHLERYRALGGTDPNVASRLERLAQR